MHRIRSAPLAQREPSPWVFAALTAAFWYEALWLGSLGSDAAMPPALAAAAGVGAQLAFTALEASLAVAAWGMFGVRVAWSAIAPRLLTVSAAEAAAVAVAGGHPALAAPWGPLLAGTRAAPGVMPPGAFAQAFATFGLLTLVRLALAAYVHASTSRAGWARAALIVLGFYLASRCAMWWTLDLMRGHSFESGLLP